MIQQICDNNGVLIEEREILDIPQPAPEPAPTMSLEEIILDKLTEIEYRQDLMELGLTEGGTEI